MIKIAYTPPNELEISGSQSDMSKIQSYLLTLSENSYPDYAISADHQFDPSPYKKALSSLRIGIASGPTKITVIGAEMIIKGSVASLAVLASYFDFDKDDFAGTHNHHEYFEGNTYIHPASIPVVIRIK